MSTSDLLAFFNSVVTLTAAVVAALVTYRIGKGQKDISERQAEVAEREAKTSYNKLKLDLFDRRLSIYDVVCDIVDEWTLPENHTSERKARFVTAMNSSRWIFPEEVYQYLKHEVYPEMNDLQVMQHRSELTEEEKKDCLRTEARLMGHRDQRIDQVFGPHLTLEA
ncbi:hypothetical protein CLV01_3360 [Delftia sp. 60]|uniref:hypothetical protein n=1 Tax=Delftia sp. 60 TaxID=2035216 RepID=UPI000C191E39|nr:hypothetical protein [Delftia sp. 60]PIF37861.1 hypothetical protein CLU98_3089 [Burkholderiales bacterium 23]PIF66958.1 hypothetical protein CLV01_3360 [Delftia sp. 60]